MDKHRRQIRQLRRIIRQRPIVSSVIGVLFLIVLAQLLYPANRLVPFASIDSINLSGQEKDDATKQLDTRIASTKIPLRLDSASDTYMTVKPQDVGIHVSNQSRVDASSYPFLLRLVPSSLVWYRMVSGQKPPVYTFDKSEATSFVVKKLGNCKLKATNATLTYKDGSLQLVPSHDGGSCNSQKVVSTLSSLQPTISKPGEIHIDGHITKPAVTDTVALALRGTLRHESDEGVKVQVGKDVQTIPQKNLLSWLDFSSSANKLTFSIDTKRSDSYFAGVITNRVSLVAGTTKIATRDFTEVSHKTGANGRTLNGDATRASIKEVLMGKKDSADAITKKVLPKVVYSRSYTKTSTGISALIAQYGQDHPGTFGISFQELGGEKRSAEYNGSKIFTTASTYKLFVAYGTLKKVEAGKWRWSDDINGGRDLTKCFDDMIVKSDNACAEALLFKLGLNQLTKDIGALGMPHSGFTQGKTPQTTPNELRLFLTKLQTGKLPLKTASRDRLLAAMKRQVYRQGIPSGASGPVADKVGFLDALLHDAAIVYSPKGTYVLVVMTDGSTWGNIADLTHKLERLRS